jgi:hypothetical protein
MQRAIGPHAIGMALSAALVLAVLLEWGAYQSGVRAEARATARRVLPANYCVQCHADPKMVQRMLIEKDDNNGTIAYCAGVSLPSQLKHPATQARSSGAPTNASWPTASK